MTKSTEIFRQMLVATGANPVTVPRISLSRYYDMSHSELILKQLTAQTGRVDDDPEQTREWFEALDAVVRVAGPARAACVLEKLKDRAGSLGVENRQLRVSAYCDSIPVRSQPKYPGDRDLEERITSIICWNALAKVVRANKAHGELGGHRSYQSIWRFSGKRSAVAPIGRTCGSAPSCGRRVLLCLPLAGPQGLVTSALGPANRVGHHFGPRVF